MRYRRVEPTRRLYTRGAETDGPVSTPRAVIALPCSLCGVSSAVEQLIPPLPFRSCSSDREEHLPVLRQRPEVVRDDELQCIADLAHSRHRVGAIRRQQLRALLDILVHRLRALDDLDERVAPCPKRLD